MRELLLFSNTKSASSPELLAHGRGALLEALGARREIVFVPFARRDWDAYTELIDDALRPLGVAVRGVSGDTSARADVDGAEAVFVGGGNTFRLLAQLQRLQLVEPIRHAVARGALYVGSSAGTNVAAPSIRTTNDMPIVQPDSFESLGLVPFQVNPHYIDHPESSTSTSETREQRVVEYLEENTVPVIGLREDTWLHVDGGCVLLAGASSGARVFRRGQPAEDIAPGADLSALLAQQP